MLNELLTGTSAFTISIAGSSTDAGGVTAACVSTPVTGSGCGGVSAVCSVGSSVVVAASVSALAKFSSIL